jgi:hypothetical protein
LLAFSLQSALTTYGVALPATLQTWRRESKASTTPTAAAVLGHTNASYFNGVTAAYGRPLSESTWAKRLKEDYRDNHGVEVSDTAFSRKRKQLDSAEASKQSHIDGVGVGHPIVRKAAGIAVTEGSTGKK